MPDTEPTEGEPMRSAGELAQEEAAVTNAEAEAIDEECEVPEACTQVPALAGEAAPLRELVTKLEATAEEFPELGQRCAIAIGSLSYAADVLEAD